MARQGQKLTDELKEQIRAHLVLSDNKNEIAKALGVSWSTVDKVAKEMIDVPEEEEKYEKLREDKKNAMINKIWDILVDSADLGHNMIREAKQGVRDVPLNHISTFYGTMYDKMALMKGENTANVGVNGGIDIAQLTPEERRARIDELNRRRGT
jgi:hypothetical protein